MQETACSTLAACSKVQTNKSVANIPHEIGEESSIRVGLGKAGDQPVGFDHGAVDALS